MAALAYLLLPLSGLVAFSVGGDVRVRFHGLQAIAFGTALAIALYGAGAVAPAATLVVAGLGTVAWAGLVIGTALGRDPRLPLVADTLWAVARRER